MQAGGPFFPTMIDLARRSMRQADPGVAALRAARRGRTGPAAHLRPARGGVCPRQEAIRAVKGQAPRFAGEPVGPQSVERRNPFLR
jgi:hypothetical protein